MFCKWFLELESSLNKFSIVYLKFIFFMSNGNRNNKNIYIYIYIYITFLNYFS